MKRPLHREARSKWLLGITAGWTVLLLCVRVVYLPLVGQIGERRAALNDLRVKIADTTVLAGQLQREEQALQAAQARYRLLEDRIGKGQSMARVLDSIGQLASAHKLDLLAVQSRPGVDDQRLVKLGSGLALREVPVSLHLVGRYQQLGEFLGRLSVAAGAASVQELAMTPWDAGDNRLDAKLLLAIHLAEQIQRP